MTSSSGVGGAPVTGQEADEWRTGDVIRLNDWTQVWMRLPDGRWVNELGSYVDERWIGHRERDSVIHLLVRNGEPQPADEADYDAASARQFQRREPDPSVARWEPGELNDCTCRACHVTSTFGGMRVIVDPNVPHGHPGVILHSEDDLTDADQCDGRTERQTDE